VTRCFCTNEQFESFTRHYRFSGVSLGWCTAFKDAYEILAFFKHRRSVYGALSVIECVRIIRYVKANQIDEGDGDESVNLQLVNEGDGVGPRRLLAMIMLVMN